MERRQTSERRLPGGLDRRLPAAGRQSPAPSFHDARRVPTSGTFFRF